MLSRRHIQALQFQALQNYNEGSCVCITLSFIANHALSIHSEMCLLVELIDAHWRTGVK
eukprot:SAG31_NODE_29_length_32663_cov_14.779695_3_plen_59_part_00